MQQNTEQRTNDNDVRRTTTTTKGRMNDNRHPVSYPKVTTGRSDAADNYPDPSTYDADHVRRHVDILDYLKSKTKVIGNSDCWLWDGDYRDIPWNIIWSELHDGVPPTADQFVGNTCFTRLCVNPDHLTLVARTKR